MKAVQANALFENAFPRAAVSDNMFVRLIADAPLGIFRSEEHTRRWIEVLPPALKNEIMHAGMNRILAAARARAKLGVAGAANRAAKGTQKMRLMTQKARTFDRIVEMLDARTVDGKQLGDCTRADLLREARRLDSEAEEMTLDAELYRELASVIGNQTVRAAAGRDKIVALLTHRWGEESEAA